MSGTDKFEQEAEEATHFDVKSDIYWCWHRVEPESSPTNAEPVCVFPVRIFHCQCGQAIGWELSNDCLQISSVWLLHGSRFQCRACNRVRTWRADGNGGESKAMDALEEVGDVAQPSPAPMRGLT